MSEDPRPRCSICHVPLTATDPIVLGEFYASIGMRPVAKMEHMSILELRCERTWRSSEASRRPRAVAEYGEGRITLLDLLRCAGQTAGSAWPAKPRRENRDHVGVPP